METPETIKSYGNIKRVPISEIKPYEKNQKTHPVGQIEKLKRAIKEYGFTVPMILDENLEIISGHGRLVAAKELGMSLIPCIIRNDLTESQKKALRISDNKVAESPWDMELLKESFEELKLDDFDMELNGFDFDEIDDVLEVGTHDSPPAREKEHNQKNPSKIVHTCPDCGCQFEGGKE